MSRPPTWGAGGGGGVGVVVMTANQDQRGHAR